MPCEERHAWPWISGTPSRTGSSSATPDSFTSVRSELRRGPKRAAISRRRQGCPKRRSGAERHNGRVRVSGRFRPCRAIRANRRHLHRPSSSLRRLFRHRGKRQALSTNRSQVGKRRLPQRPKTEASGMSVIRASKTEEAQDPALQAARFGW